MTAHKTPDAAPFPGAAAFGPMGEPDINAKLTDDPGPQFDAGKGIIIIAGAVCWLILIALMVTG